MLGFVQLLSKTDTTMEQACYLSRLQASCQDLLSIVNDILDFAKAEEGKIELESVPFNLKKAINEAVSLFKALAVGKDVSIRLSLDPEIPDFVIGDPVRFNQILNNLLSNAVKFTLQGGIDVVFRLIEQRAAFCTLECAIVDTGVGMDEDTINRLFQPFMQADSSMTRKYGGTGLGLSIVNSLVRVDHLGYR